MARYDWPVGPYSADDPDGRTGYLAQFRPRVDVATLTEPVSQPIAKGAPPAGVVPHLAPSGATNLWFPIGPSAMLNGQAKGDPNVAGRIRDLQVGPSTGPGAGQRIYAASASGGLWLSEDRGVTWKQLDEWQEWVRTGIGIVANALACGAVHVKFGASAVMDEVWVGTGELSGGAKAQPGGQVAGIGFLHYGPAIPTGWEIVKGDPVATDPDTLRGATVYRIVSDPNDDQQLVAGTSKGLYVRSSAAGATWTKAANWVNATKGHPVDVVLTRTGTGKVRIWVAAYSNLWVAETTSPIVPATITFDPVGLPNVLSNPAATDPAFQSTRLAIAKTTAGPTKLYVLGRRDKLPSEPKAALPPAELWEVDATAAIPGLAGIQKPGLPADLFGSKLDQSYYDMCIATHPTAADTLYVGGSTKEITPGDHNAALYKCVISASGTSATYIGEGAHADVHQLRVIQVPGNPPGPTLWVGCDGGLFRTDAPGDPGPAGLFKPCNDGLAVLEPGYVASHPTNPGIVAAGFQDNGTAVRSGDTVWWEYYKGDGGGVVYDPVAPNRYFRQYTLAEWHSSDGGAKQPVNRRRARKVGDVKTSESIEHEASRFYSGAAAVRHPESGDTHLAIGSDRVWYSRDWGRSWVTLPTGSDPRDQDSPDLIQDVLERGDYTTYADQTGSTDCCEPYRGVGISGTGIMTVKFATPTPTATHDRLRLLVLTANGLVWLNGSRPLATPGPFTWEKLEVSFKQMFKEPVTPAEQTAYNNGDPLAFLPAKARVSDVAVHRPDRGLHGSCYVSTIGEDPFSGHPGDRRDTLWFFDGTDKWWPCGLRTINPARSTWVGGEPARVTAPALGVVVDPDNDQKFVYVATSIGVVRGELTIGGPPASPTYSWNWAPFMNGLPEAAVQDLSIFKSDGAKLLRAALQARGVWETDLANPSPKELTYLRAYPSDTRRVMPTQLDGPTTAGEDPPPRWDNSPDIVVTLPLAAGSEPHTEADLRKLPGLRTGGSVGQVLTSFRNLAVHVLVHHRWSQPEQAGNVRVALIRHALPANGVVPLGNMWTDMVNAESSPGPPASLPDGWSKASNALWKTLPRAVDSRMPVVVTFDLNLTGAADGTAIVLLAVVMSGSNKIADDSLVTIPPAATTARQLVQQSPHVAAKSIELTS